MKKLIVFMAFVSLVSCQASSNLKDTFLFGLGSGVSLIAPVMGYCAGQNFGHCLRADVFEVGSEERVFLSGAVGIAAFGLTTLCCRKVENEKYKNKMQSLLPIIKLATGSFFAYKFIDTVLRREVSF